MSADRPAETARRGLAGRVLGGRYRVLRMVSAGANTLIAEAQDQELDRRVTVKLVRPELAESDRFRRHFATTMRAMSKLSHPNIAAVYDWGEEEVGKRTTVYAVVEHLAGGSVRDLFDRGRQLDPSQALVVGLEVCRGLDFAHRKNLVHGELTPSKLVFGDDRRLRIVDFGLARLLGAADWKEPSSVPTHVARYCSPEQALGQPIDGKSDVYSLALILVEAVTGSVPFAARSTVATLSARVGRLMPVSADLGALAAVLERAGRPDPVDRSTASELGRSLVRAAESLPRPTPIPILVTSAFQEDPNQIRRPNDPTGGIARPAPEPTAPLVPPVEAAASVTMDPAPPDGGPIDTVVPSDPAEPTVPDAPEERAAGASMAGAAALAAGTAAEDLAAAAGQPAGGAADVADASEAGAADSGAASAATVLPPPPPAPAPAAPPVDTARPDAPPPGPDAAAPTLYDGDEDLVKDELAALAQLPVDTGDAWALAGDPAAAPPTAAAVVTSPPTDVVPATASAAPTAPKRRRRWLPWLVAVLLIGALAGLGYFAYTLFKVPTHPVPELVGLDEQAARAQTAGFNWDIDVQHARSDEHPEPGEIIRTAPSAGEDLAEDEPFLIVVSDGPEFRTLPDLTGLTQAAAETQLAELQLTAAAPVQQNDEDVPVGSVISWSVPSDPTLTTGGQALPGTEVQLVVSTGPAPRTVPTLVGLSVDQATAALEAVQLGVSVAEPVFSDDIPIGSVVSANPPDGTGGIARGTVVTITPSKGVDLVVMPDITGSTLEQARAALAVAGLQVGSLLGNSQGIYVSGTVLGQPATTGAQFKRGSAVDLVFL